MNVSVRIAHCSDDTASLTVSGEMDSSNCELVESILDSLVSRGARYITVDASELRFCDVAGAYMLARIHRRLRVAGGELVVTAPEAVTGMFDALKAAGGPERGPETVPGLSPGLGPESPAQAGERGRGAVPGAPRVRRRHLPVPRRFGSGRSGRSGRTGAAERRRSAAPPSTSPVSPVFPVSPVSSAVPQAAPHPALERAARLRRETAAQLEILLLRAARTCTALAEVHERLASCHATLAARVTPREKSRLKCDDRFHRMEAERLRVRALRFTGGGDG
ncbi:STAS domain-containing protein [Planobispora rosea]|uniref:STAS domain-containing protein n=1 Tax=Planobispora rosea TaxID=35762 RepID=UPI003140018C